MRGGTESQSPRVVLKAFGQGPVSDSAAACIDDFDSVDRFSEAGDVEFVVRMPNVVVSVLVSAEIVARRAHGTGVGRDELVVVVTDLDSGGLRFRPL